MVLIKVHTWDGGWECSSALGPVALHPQSQLLEPADDGGAEGAAHPGQRDAKLTRDRAGESEALEGPVRRGEGGTSEYGNLAEEAEKAV